MSNALYALGSGYRGPLDVTTAAVVVLNARDTVIGWSPSAQALLGYQRSEIVGRSFASLSTESGVSVPVPAPGQPLEVRHRNGRVLRLATEVCSLGYDPEYDAPEQPARVLLAADLDELRQWEAGQAMLRGLITQSPVGLNIYDTELGVVWANTAAGREMAGPIAQYVGTHVDELFPGGEVLSEDQPRTLEQVVRRVLATGETVVDLHYRARLLSDPEQERVWSCSYYRLQDAYGNPLGVCEESVDITDRYQAQQRLDLLVRAGQAIGTTLDVTVTARELAEVAVPRFADAVTVDLLEDVLSAGTDMGTGTGTGTGSPVPGVAGASGVPRLIRAPDRRPSNYSGTSPQMRSLLAGHPVMERLATDEAAEGPSGTETAAAERRPDSVRWALVVPLRAEETALGVVTFLRDGRPGEFDAGERELADELAKRTAVCIDNARRFARERGAALTLQRSLLPKLPPSQTAVDLAYRYLPADSRAGVGGDWFDVIPLSGTRVGLVVGDVVGHGLGAAATMGRLRTSVRALARLDLAPDELLSRLDDLICQVAKEDKEELVGRAARESEATRNSASEADGARGATCLYAVYDPVSGRCSMASAGHLPPLVVAPGTGHVSHPDLEPGPPLGVGGLPFESTEVELPEGGLLVLFTDGLVHAADRDVDAEVRRLGDILAEPARPLEELCDRAVTTLLPGPVSDDAALLVARTRRLGPEQSIVWEFEADPATVAQARKATTEQLGRWDLEELAFTTELVVSELVTNAIRYAGGPIQLRLIRDQTLICEVSDTGHTSPHLRHAASDDEGGRGLFLIAQMTGQWGTRYTPTGKTIWAEQALP
ncbi:SpoIIE family protein phosphatase [Streptomyces sp. NPDC050315]|uniref:SpoIIE family protein phosphatase n=1 Tax=Streptomyces sp. NPDC050315 TaxID=3155039 RepID=UPI0034395B46